MTNHNLPTSTTPSGTASTTTSTGTTGTGTSTTANPRSLRRRLLWPKLRLDRTQDIVPELLGLHGIKALLLDLDNTLIPHGSLAPRPEIEAWVTEMRQSGIDLRLVSNATPHRLRHWAARLGR
jgi:hypothetical protein